METMHVLSIFLAPQFGLLSLSPLAPSISSLITHEKEQDKLPIQGTALVR